MIAETAERVFENTAAEINARIHRQIEANVAHCAAQGINAIDQRLDELDREWDIERCLETMAPTISLLGLGLGIAVDKKFLLFPIVVQAFFLQHALQGWCPPIPVLRRLGVRTPAEIEHERNALKALRGDYRQVPARAKSANAVRRAVAAAER
jgi:hypothetical protein